MGLPDFEQPDSTIKASNLATCPPKNATQAGLPDFDSIAVQPPANASRPDETLQPRNYHPPKGNLFFEQIPDEDGFVWDPYRHVKFKPLGKTFSTNKEVLSKKTGEEFDIYDLNKPAEVFLAQGRIPPSSRDVVIEDF